MALGTEQVQKLTIAILEDFDNGRGGLRDVSKEITNFEIAPDGSRALFGARGDIFTVPEKNGNTRNLTNTSGVHERNAKWSPDGKWIACISDQSGEDEIYHHAAGRHGATRTADTQGVTRTNTSCTGHPTARNCSGRTNNSACSMWMLSRSRSPGWHARQRGNSPITPGRPTAGGSPTPARKKSG